MSRHRIVHLSCTCKSQFWESLCGPNVRSCNCYYGPSPPYTEPSTYNITIELTPCDPCECRLWFDPHLQGNIGDDIRYYSGVVQGTADKVVTIPQGDTDLLAVGSTSEVNIFAVCYSEGDGSTADVYWRDSYIRVKPTDLHELMAKEVTHRTYGQLPSHPASPIGLQYEFTGPLVQGASGDVHVSLVDATLGSLSNTGFSSSISNPCECNEADCEVLATGSADESHSGKAVKLGSGNYFNTIPTTQLVTTKTYALCYSSNSETGTQHSGNFFDSGVRLTVPKVSSCYP